MKRLAWADAVLAFWFEELAPRDWWKGSPVVDARVRERFGALHATVAADPPRGVDLDAREHLAAVLVLDQFSRHLARGSAAAFANDGVALALARHAIDRGLDETLGTQGRQFLYMPLMHSEDATMQSIALERFTALGDADSLRSARDHHATIARFGRFPARNAALGRTSTPAEREFLAGRGED